MTGTIENQEFTEFTRHSLTLDSLTSSSTVDDVKTAIMKELMMNKDVQIYRGDQVLEDGDDEIGDITDGEAIVAWIQREGGESEDLSAKVQGGSAAVWLVSGNNWNFRMVKIPSDALTPVNIKANTYRKLFKQEHKFALVNEKPEDGIWKGRRYELQEEGATIELQDDGAGWFTVTVVIQGGETRPIRYELIPGPEKTYDERVMSDREKKKDRTLAVVSCVAGVLARLLV